MSRLIRLGHLLLLAAAAAGCTVSPVGDPCIPESIPAGGFDPREVYLETSSVQCRTRVCMVFELAGDPTCTREEGGGAGCVATVKEVDDQIFCTCRCSVPAGTSTNLPLCQCGDGYRCVDNVVTRGGDGVRGGYCVPCIKDNDPRNLTSPPFDSCNSTP